MLSEVGHRPWPLPAGPWIMAQKWHDLLFAHWPVPADLLRPLVPAVLPLDTFDGFGWLGVVPFRMSGVRLRGMPSLPWFSAFPELNVRTYVSLDGKPGVFFWSLDATNALAVAVARSWFRLPYMNARMSLVEDGGAIEVACVRTHSGAPPAEFAATYAPTGAVSRSPPGTLDHWLTERYCLYTAEADGRVRRADIHHAPWPLQPARAELRANTMARAAGVALPDRPPVLHFARRLDVVVWAPRVIRPGREGAESLTEPRA
ncbi:MAG: DUF2071 domain-containing protein [Planctomycetes bacterium]|nr:DUF2071 domain-containing protein [Planctomycetota bacterium]